jgi:hypothetical protein
VSAFLHHDEVASPADEQLGETDDEGSMPEEVDEDQGERMISNALRTELALARRRASNLLLVTIISVLMAIAVFVVAMMTRTDESSVVAPEAEDAAPLVADPVDPLDQGVKVEVSP